MAPSHRVTVAARAVVTPAIIASGDIIRLGVGVSVVTGLLGTGDQEEGIPDLLNGLSAVDLEKDNTSKEKERESITELSWLWAAARTQTEAVPSLCFGGQTRDSNRP